MSVFVMARATSKNRFKNLIGVLLAPVAFYMLFRWFEHTQVYQPFTRLEANGDVLGRPFEDVYFQERPKLNGWFFPANTNSPRAHLAVLICHGNAGNISHRLDLYKLLLATGVNVFAFDYRGYGRSEGKPSEAGTYQDAQSAHSWLLARGFAGTNIIALGESLGGAVASELALRQPLGGLALQSAFTSILDIGTELFPWLPVRIIATIKYDTRSKLPEIKVPVLVMHGPSDSVIPFHHAERNFAAANEPKLFWKLEGDHNDPVTNERENYLKGFERFLAMVEHRQPENTRGAGQSDSRD
jgi:fermentation-respiration switch protein FrsA (DUF1100 family)